MFELGMVHLASTRAGTIHAFNMRPAAADATTLFRLWSSQNISESF